VEEETLEVPRMYQPVEKVGIEVMAITNPASKVPNLTCLVPDMR
jgi:hypothetical protein